ncbi:MAG: Gfo/Idh/MocA family oxidoreductase [Fimbriimonadaceae bacterium]|nr:Gfo/Idh/MocA family oxidoreductase [Fimbriimonadaceae bacterium]
MAAGCTTWGVIGAGGVARRRMLPAVAGHPEVRLGAVMVRDAARAAALAAEFGAAAAYDSVADLLADPAIEAVYIASPPAYHEAQGLAAAAAGKAVLLEKPLALSVAAGERLVAACAAAGVPLATCFPLRHHAALQRLRAALNAGQIGTPVLLRAQLCKWYPLDPAAWRADPALAGGGVVWDLGSHLLDLASWLLGPPRGVHGWRTAHGQAGRLDDTAVLTAQHESGAISILEMSFAVGATQQGVEASGTTGTLRCPGFGSSLVGATADGDWQEELPLADTFGAALLDCGRALRGQRRPAADGGDGLRNIALLRQVEDAGPGVASGTLSAGGRTGS